MTCQTSLWNLKNIYFCWPKQKLKISPIEDCDKLDYGLNNIVSIERKTNLVTHFNKRKTHSFMMMKNKYKNLETLLKKYEFRKQSGCNLWFSFNVLYAHCYHIRMKYVETGLCVRLGKAFNNMQAFKFLHNNYDRSTLESII